MLSLHCSGMGMAAIQDSFERVAYEQILWIGKSLEEINKIGHEIEQAIATMQSNNDSGLFNDLRTVLTALNDKLQHLDSLHSLEVSSQELEKYIVEHLKVLDKTLVTDISRAYRNVNYESQILNKIIIKHLYREGMFDVVDCFLQEACEPDIIPLRWNLEWNDAILKALKLKNIKPALEWFIEQEDSDTGIMQKLHRLKFVDMVENGNDSEALQYARTYLAHLADSNPNEMHRLTGSLNKAESLCQSPYANLWNPIHLKELIEEVSWRLHKFSGQPSREHLSVVITAGVEALLTLLELADMAAAKGQDWQKMEQLPPDLLPLRNEYRFHSVFICSVSYHRCSQDNPPKMLPCKHILCAACITKFQESITLTYTCPFCIQETSFEQAMRLYF